jgi:hypothetical protein
MNSVRETYNPERLEQVRRLLDTQIRKGLPVEYEIYVDSFKVVPKTNDINEFDSYEDYISPGSRSMRLLIYDNVSGTEQVNECVYKMSSFFNKQTSQGSELSGVEIEDRITSQVQSRMDKFEHDRDLSETKKQLRDAKERISELEDELEKEQEKKGLETLKWGQIGSVVVENIIKRNPQLLSVIPGGEALAGVLMQPGEIPKSTSQEPESEMTFKEKKAPVLSEKEHAFHNIFIAFENRFDPKGLEQINFILHEMLKDPSVVSQIADLLKEDSGKAPQAES